MKTLYILFFLLCATVAQAEFTFTKDTSFKITVTLESDETVPDQIDTNLIKKLYLQKLDSIEVSRKSGTDHKYGFEGWKLKYFTKDSVNKLYLKEGILSFKSLEEPKKEIALWIIILFLFIIVVFVSSRTKMWKLRIILETLMLYIITLGAAMSLRFFSGPSHIIIFAKITYVLTAVFFISSVLLYFLRHPESKQGGEKWIVSLFKKVSLVTAIASIICFVIA